MQSPGDRRGVILIQLAGRGKEEEEEVGVAENRELPGFLKQTVPSFIESRLPLDRVLYPLYLRSPSPHVARGSGGKTRVRALRCRSPPLQTRPPRPWACRSNPKKLTSIWQW